jgi:cell division septal protein FtsQ
MKWLGRKKNYKKPRAPKVGHRPARGNSHRHLVNVIVALALVAVLGLGGWLGYPYAWDYLCSISYFKVTRITFTGLQMVKEPELRALLPRVGGVNLFALNFPDLEMRLKCHPWVANAHLKRHLPEGLYIDITERKPVALLSRDGLWALDVQAVALPLDGGRGELDLPLVIADSGQTPQAGSALREEPLVSFLPLLNALHQRTPNLWNAISEVSWDANGELELYAFGNPARILVGKTPTWRQMLNFYSFVVYQGRRSGLDDIAFMDLRFPGQVVIRRNQAPADSLAKPKS